MMYVTGVMKLYEFIMTDNTYNTKYHNYVKKSKARSIVGEFANCLGTFRDSMLGEFTWEEKLDSGLNLS